MKSDIHPDYRFVVFRDINTGNEFITRSCVPARDTTEFEGEEYPLVVLDVTSESHPFYTGTQRIMDTEGRVDRFLKKYGFAAGGSAEEAPATEAPAEDGPADAGPEAPVAEAPASEA